MQRTIATIILLASTTVDAHPGHGTSNASTSHVDLFIVAAVLVAAVAFVARMRTVSR